MTFVEELLEIIATAGGIMPPYKAYRGKFHPSSGTYYKSLSRLQQKGLIKKKHSQTNQTNYVITAEGQKLLYKSSHKVSRTDGFSTLITFDIPENRRRERNLFRRYLLRNGFTLIQKSLLVSPNQVNDELLHLIKELKFNSFVKIISGRFDYL